jgi:hypothetical protein
MSGGARGVRALLDRVIGLADKTTDDDDLRLRKRVVHIAGYVVIVSALQLPLLAQGHPLGWFVAATIPLVGAINLVVLARTGRFERYVNVLILMVLLLPAVIEVSLGGLAGASAALVFRVPRSGVRAPRARTAARHTLVRRLRGDRGRRDRVGARKRWT